MAGGRPIKWDKDKEADRLLEWSEDENSVTLLNFCNQSGYPPEYLSVWSKENDKFSHALKLAKCRVGERREKLVSTGKLYHGAWQRGAAVYDHFIHTHERAVKEHEIKIKAQQDAVEKKNLIDLAKEANQGNISQS